MQLLPDPLHFCSQIRQESGSMCRLTGYLGANRKNGVFGGRQLTGEQSHQCVYPKIKLHRHIGVVEVPDWLLQFSVASLNPRELPPISSGASLRSIYLFRVTQVFLITQARFSLALACRLRVKQGKTLCSTRPHLSETLDKLPQLPNLLSCLLCGTMHLACGRRRRNRWFRQMAG